MSDEEVETLKAAIQLYDVFWKPDVKLGHITRITDDYPVEEESGPCALFSFGKYIALDCCYGDDFLVRLFDDN